MNISVLFQSLGLPSLKHKQALPNEFSFPDNGYGVPSALQSGWNSARSQLAPSHPLEASIRNVSFKTLNTFKQSNHVLMIFIIFLV